MQSFPLEEGFAGADRTKQNWSHLSLLSHHSVFYTKGE